MKQLVGLIVLSLFLLFSLSNGAQLSCYHDPQYFESCYVDMFDEANDPIRTVNLTAQKKYWDDDTNTGRKLQGVASMFFYINLKDDWDFTEV